MRANKWLFGITLACAVYFGLGALDLIYFRFYFFGRILVFSMAYPAELAILIFFWDKASKEIGKMGGKLCWCKNESLIRNSNYAETYYRRWGKIIIGVPFILLFLISLKFGYKSALFIASTAYFTDMGGHFFGQNILRAYFPNYKPHILFSEVNGDKSYEAMILSIILTNVLCNTIGMILFTPKFITSPAQGVLPVFLGSIGGVIGDIAESQFKRLTDVKDSSEALGSHGGFLDRIDSLIGTIITYVVYLFAFLLYIYGR